MSVLLEILKAIAAQPRERRVVLFDLDGTLYDNRPRTLRILHAFAAALPSEYAHDARIIRGLNADHLRYRLEDSLAPHGVSSGVIQLAQKAWAQRFFTDAACADDVPVPGSVAFVRKCWELGASIVYLTGRDVPGMLLGTCRTLRDDGFPLAAPGIELVMKPTFEEGDTAFKQRVFDDIDKLGTVIASFDNEPINCNLTKRRWPASFSVLLDTLRTPDAPECDPGVAVVRTFELPPS